MFALVIVILGTTTASLVAGQHKYGGDMYKPMQKYGGNDYEPKYEKHYEPKYEKHYEPKYEKVII